jgi:hypothetical protein
MHTILKRAALLVLAGTLAACSASAKVAVSQPKSAAISSDSVVALEVKAVGTDADEDTEAVLQKLRSSLFGGLVANGVFKQVVHTSDPADYRLAISIDGVRAVSQGARIFFGVLAGENQLAAHCLLTDSASGEKVADFTVTGASAAHPLSSENDMDDAIGKVVEKIVASLR